MCKTAAPAKKSAFWAMQQRLIQQSRHSSSTKMLSRTKNLRPRRNWTAWRSKDRSYTAIRKTLATNSFPLSCTKGQQAQGIITATFSTKSKTSGWNSMTNTWPRWKRKICLKRPSGTASPLRMHARCSTATSKIRCRSISLFSSMPGWSRKYK